MRTPAHKRIKKQTEKPMLDIGKIIQRPLPETNYFKEIHTKSQIFIHHTAGSANPFNVVTGWKARTDKVATAFIIAGKPSKETDGYKDGDIVQCFSSKYWAYHLGLKSDVFKKMGVPYKSLDKTSIGIEICNWGWVMKQPDGTFKNYVNGTVPSDEVVDLGTEYRNKRYYHKYTDAQLQATKDLLEYLCKEYNIPKTYYDNMFDVNKDCLSDKSGIWTHTSVRYDKWDCSPQPNLKSFLKSLSITTI